MRKFTVKLGLAMLLGSSVLAAGVPNTINYQGRLTDAAGDAVPDGAILVKFQIYDAATGGTVLWNSLFQTINTVDGLFSYDLGSNVALPDLFGTDSVRYLGITVGTDPEISPRSRFTSSGYVFRSQKSDLALDADSLGGLQPAFYLDWRNMTSIPAGFADGVDDEGIDQVTADGRYVNLTGDVMTGDLHIEKASGITTVDLFGGTIDYGQLQLRQSNDKFGVILGAPDGFGGWLKLSDTSGATTHNFFGQSSGDASVVIPNDAINSLEMLDEPGIAQGRSNSSYTLNTVNMIDLTTVSITIPTSGYIFLQGRAMCYLTGTTGINQVMLQIDQTAGGSYNNWMYSMAGLSSYGPVSSIGHTFDCTAQRTYFKSAGTHTFRLEAMRTSLSLGRADCYYPVLTAMFFPTSYGSVSTVAEQPGDHPDAQAVSMTGPDGTVSTGYKMDLRYYEEKARVARIAKQKAELAEAEAELELAKAKGASEKE